jgi:3-hydroxybutyryl-CoA dehydratase
LARAGAESELIMYDRFYDEVVVGDSGTYGGVTVTEAHVVGFAGITGDHHPLHVDAEFAARSRYGQRIAHGFLVLSLSAGLFPMKREAVLAFYGMDGVRFVKPTYLGDTLSCRLTVRSKTDKAVGGVVETALEMINQRDEVVAVATMRILVARDPARTPTDDASVGPPAGAVPAGAA